jgi:hypothetical protein
MKGYSSFLVRCWQLDSGAQRITIEHVQSGEQIAVATLDAATRWIGAQGIAPPGVPRGGACEPENREGGGTWGEAARGP